MVKVVKRFLLVIVVCLLLSGCTKQDNIEGESQFVFLDSRIFKQADNSYLLYYARRGNTLVETKKLKLPKENFNALLVEDNEIYLASRGGIYTVIHNELNKKSDLCTGSEESLPDGRSFKVFNDRFALWLNSGFSDSGTYSWTFMTNNKCEVHENVNDAMSYQFENMYYTLLTYFADDSYGTRSKQLTLQIYDFLTDTYDMHQIMLEEESQIISGLLVKNQSVYIVSTLNDYQTKIYKINLENGESVSQLIETQLLDYRSNSIFMMDTDIYVVGSQLIKLDDHLNTLDEKTIYEAPTQDSSNSHIVDDLNILIVSYQENKVSIYKKDSLELEESITLKLKGLKNGLIDVDIIRFETK